MLTFGINIHIIYLSRDYFFSTDLNLLLDSFGRRPKIDTNAQVPTNITLAGMYE